jgi:hypothetical protein
VWARCHRRAGVRDDASVAHGILGSRIIRTRAGVFDTCVSAQCSFVLCGHLSTHTRQRNCDQGRRRSAPPPRTGQGQCGITFNRNSGASSKHFVIVRANGLRSNGAVGQYARRDPLMRPVATPRRPHDLRPSAYTCRAVLLSPCARWAEKRRIDRPAWPIPDLHTRQQRILGGDRWD